ncbi:MAG TPA: mechanosensitive ion channel domain-containing protein [Gemmatimonadaceae bacterium]
MAGRSWVTGDGRTGTRRIALGLAVLVGAALPAARLPAQDPAAGGDSTLDSTAIDVSPASPRAAVELYLTLARAARFAEAATFLELPEARRDEGPQLARQLKAVLDRNLWVDLERVSPLERGDISDGLPASIEQLGTIRDVDSAARPVRLIRNQDGSPSWRFSSATVELIPRWYESLDDRWILENLPAVLLRPGPFEVLRWQWIALLLIVGIGILFGKVAGRLGQSAIGRITMRTRVTWDDEVIQRLAGPLSAALALAAVAALVGLLGLYPPAAAMSFRVVRAGYFLVFYWSLFRLIDVGFHMLRASPWARTSTTSAGLIPLGSRVTKIAVLAIAVVAALSVLGYPVASLVAGLGLGGLALALAAQKTVENLFGAFSLGVDQPFRVGDFVKIEDFVATVEQIGLRSTRFRTLDRTLVTIPNGKLADSRLESYSARDRIRLHTIIGLVYETTQAQMREVLAGFERVLRDHPHIWPDAVVVRFREFAASSLDVEIMAWFQTRDFAEFQAIRQEVLLGFMGVVERAGTSIAFPTRTIHVVGDQSAIPSGPHSA